MPPASDANGVDPDTERTLPRYHRPAGGRLGDAIPFFWAGTWHVFYLDYRPEFYNHTPPGARQTAWAHVSSPDLIDWRRHPDAIAPGPEGAVDSGSCATGSVFAHDGVFHLFYTGRYFTTRGQRRETICHAASTDLLTWHKDPDNPIARPDAERYVLENWRDPFVYWHPETQEFWMAITAEHRHGPRGRTGCVAVLASRDLQTWQPRDPLWAPALAPNHECPDVFRWGDWWYLIVSHGGRTIYRIARHPGGPWLAPAVDTFDDHFFYAAKTAGDGRGEAEREGQKERRVLFGWLAAKAGHRDTGAREWGGNLVARELVQHPDGTLWPACPSEYAIPDAPARPAGPAAPVSRIGDWQTAEGGLQHSWDSGFAYALFDTGTADCQVRTVMDWQPGTRALGLFLRIHDGPTRGYALRLEPGTGTVTFGRVTETGRIVEELRRPAPDLALLASGCPCVVTLSGSVVDLFVGDRVALTARCHDFRGTLAGLFVEEGGAAFRELALVPLPH
jgi:beta-fructofuranosidase